MFKKTFLILMVLILFAVPSAAQDEHESLARQLSLENTIVGRPLAVRLRMEVQLTEDDELLDEQIAYKRFPKEMYTSEIKLFAESGWTVTGGYEYWENDQSLAMRGRSAAVDFPLAKEWKLEIKYRDRDYGDDPDRQYYYLGLGRIFGTMYTYTRYRHTKEDGSSIGDHLYQYVSWAPCKTFLLGGTASAWVDDGSIDAWSVTAFGTRFLIEDATSVRLETRHYTADTGFDCQEYKLYLYQRISDGSLLRLNYRYYHDNDDFNSRAYGIKAKHFFSPRFSAHAGYRWYNYDEEDDFGTFIVGMSLLF